MSSEHPYNKMCASYNLGNTINCIIGNRSYYMSRSLTNDNLAGLPEDPFRLDFNQFRVYMDVIRSKI